MSGGTHQPTFGQAEFTITVALSEVEYASLLILGACAARAIVSAPYMVVAVFVILQKLFKRLRSRRALRAAELPSAMIEKFLPDGHPDFISWDRRILSVGYADSFWVKPDVVHEPRNLAFRRRLHRREVGPIFSYSPHPIA